MNSLLKLYKFEVKRLAKYNVLVISAALSAVWALILIVSGEPTELVELYPLLIFVDAAMMSILAVGAGMFFERGEGTLKGLVVSPAKTLHVLASKIMGAVTLTVISYTVVTVTFIILMWGHMGEYGIEFYNFALSFIFILLIGAVNGFIGYALTLRCRDFNGLLVLYMVYTLIFTAPVVMVPFMAPDFNTNYLLVLPPQAMEYLLNVWDGSISIPLMLGSVAYLLVIAVLLAKYLVIPKFFEYVIKD